MRRFVSVLTAALLLCLCVFSVSAAITVPEVSSHGTVNRDGRCQVTMLATVSVDEVRTDLEFPVPADAIAVRVNGSAVITKQSGDVRLIDLDKELGKMVGDFTLSINYELQDVIYTTEQKTLELRLPLLSGFSYPIETMEFSVTLPGVIENKPSFESGYHQQNIERDISYTVDGATIRGSFTQALKDHETVTMKLLVTNDMFPQSLADTRDYTFGLIGMAICGGLALLYWLLTMRNWPFRFRHTTTPPEGYTAGEMGYILGSRGVDLHLAVLSWAQMGYVVLHTDRKGNVTIHKRMEMGNERKDTEQKLFRKLFAKNLWVDTRSAFYARLAAKTAETPKAMGELLRKRTGNPKVFRIVASGIGLFGGICLAIAMSGGAFLQVLLILLLGALGVLFGWNVQMCGMSVLQPDGYKLRLYGCLSGLWLLLGLLCGAFSVAFSMVLSLWVAGVFLFISGLRTDLGKENIGLVMGLRKYLRKLPGDTAKELQKVDGDYFFALAPYAMALGVGMTFAKRFGDLRMEGGAYLHTENDTTMTAREWVRRLQRLYDAMDARARRMPMERLIAIVRSFRR